MLYDNIGGKIKGLAVVLFFLTAFAALIAGIALIATDDDLIIYGLLVILSGPIVALISSWPLFGLGELIETAKNIERNTRGGERKSMAQSILDSERINKIEKLRSQGLITEEEYQAAISKGE